MKISQPPIILVVDDNEANRYTFGRYLERSGFQVWLASTAKQAMELALRKPNLILLDVKLPDANGSQLCRQLKQSPRTAALPILLISSSLKSGRDKARGLEAGADGYVAAPVDPEELVANVNLVLRLSTSQRELHRTNKRLQEILESITDIYFCLDAQWRIVELNKPAAQNFFRRPGVDLVGKIVWEVCPESLGVDFYEKFQRALKEHQVVHFEGRALQSERWHECHVYPREELLDVYLRDITARKEAEEMLRRLNHQLDDAHTQLSEHARKLEQKVEQRTAALTEMNARLSAEIAEREAVERSREALLRQLATAEDNQRRRIARELHDEMGQHVTALSLGLKTLKDATSDSSKADKLIPPLEAITSELGKEVHRLALELRPTSLDDIGLKATLKNYVRVWSNRAGVTADFHAANYQSEGIAPEIETTFYRTVQEALNNVVKHADANCVSVVLERTDHQAQVIVEDDGCGFDPDAKLGRPNGKLGLYGMRERLALMGGSLAIESTPGSGTTVFARIPLEATR